MDHLHLVQRLRRHGFIPQLPHKLSWHDADLSTGTTFTHLTTQMCVCLCMCVCVCARVRARLFVCNALKGLNVTYVVIFAAYILHLPP